MSSYLLITSSMAVHDASQQPQHEVEASNFAFITSTTTERLDLMTKQRFQWIMDHDVMITALFTACLFLLCREIKQSECLADLDFASVPHRLLNVTHDFLDTIWHLIKRHGA